MSPNTETFHLEHRQKCGADATAEILVEVLLLLVGVEVDAELLFVQSLQVIELVLESCEAPRLSSTVQFVYLLEKMLF